MRDRLSAMIQDAVGGCAKNWADIIADHLLSEGVIVLPLKIGDTVWRIEKDWHLDDKEAWTFHFETKVVEFVVRSVSISCNSKGRWIKKIRICAGACQRHFGFEDLGKTVFLSRAEAEKALERSENGK